MSDLAYISGFMVTAQVRAYLENMCDSGLYGDGINEVLGHLVSVGVQDAIARGLTHLIPAAEFDEVEEAPAPVAGVKCGHTMDDMSCDAPDCPGMPF